MLQACVSKGGSIGARVRLALLGGHMEAYARVISQLTCRPLRLNARRQSSDASAAAASSTLSDLLLQLSSQRASIEVGSRRASAKVSPALRRAHATLEHVPRRRLARAGASGG